MYNISALMVVPAYISTKLFMAKLCWTDEYNKYAKNGKNSALASGIIGVIFCIFIYYVSSIKYVVMVPLLLTLGLPIFIWSRKEKHDKIPVFESMDIMYLIILLLADTLVLWMIFTDKVNF